VDKLDYLPITDLVAGVDAVGRRLDLYRRPGAGLVLFPENYNLLYHCFGETGYSKPSMNAGCTLPWQGWPYATHDGLGNTIPAVGSDG
jgi:hypothetical protein